MQISSFWAEQMKKINGLRGVGGWTNPSEKDANVKMDHFPEGSGWKERICEITT